MKRHAFLLWPCASENLLESTKSKGREAWNQTECLKGSN
jgi:hypothetical protein